MNGSRVVSQIFMCILTAMLKQQGVNVKGLLKGTPTKEEIPPLFDKNGKLEVIYPFIGFVARFHLIRVSVIWLIS